VQLRFWAVEYSDYVRAQEEYERILYELSECLADFFMMYMSRKLIDLAGMSRVRSILRDQLLEVVRSRKLGGELDG